MSKAKVKVSWLSKSMSGVNSLFGSGSPSTFRLLSSMYLLSCSPTTLFSTSASTPLPYIFFTNPIGTIPGRNPGTFAFWRICFRSF